MKTIIALTISLAVFAAASLRAEEPAKEMKCACMKADEKKAEENKMKAEAAEFDKLVDEMNASTGEKKIEAIAAIINGMAQKQKEMKAKCDAMMMGMMKKDGKPGAKPAAQPAALDYYTCKMHPEVHWPIPGKCPLCSMDLVPEFKKGPGAKPEGKTEAKPGEEPKKAEDPHAGHH